MVATEGPRPASSCVGRGLLPGCPLYPRKRTWFSAIAMSAFVPCTAYPQDKDLVGLGWLVSCLLIWHQCVVERQPERGQSWLKVSRDQKYNGEENYPEESQLLAV